MKWLNVANNKSINISFTPPSEMKSNILYIEYDSEFTTLVSVSDGRWKQTFSSYGNGNAVRRYITSTVRVTSLGNQDSCTISRQIY